MGQLDKAAIHKTVQPKRTLIVIKLGTGVLSKVEGRALDDRQFQRIAQEVAALHKSGTSCVIVSSAAIAAGVDILGMSCRPGDLSGKQACAAVGQPALMRAYSDAFESYGLKVAQLLLTHGDIDSRVRRANTRNTLDRLLSVGVIPIINENDSVAVEELRFGDNDRLSAEVAMLVSATQLLMLTSVDGIQDESGVRVPVISDINGAYTLVRPDKGPEAMGGMRTKLEAAQTVTAVGIQCAILDGRKPGQIAEAIALKDVGTRFQPS